MNSISQLVSDSSVRPTLKTWTAPENRLKTWYASKSGKKRLAKDTEKYNTMYLKEYNKALSDVEAALKTAEKIDTALAETPDLMDIFRRYLLHGKDWVVHIHEKRLAKQAEMKKYGDSIFLNASFLYSRIKYDHLKNAWTIVEPSNSKLLEGVNDIHQLALDLKDYVELKNADLVVGSLTVEDVVWRTVQDGLVRLNKVLDMIQKEVGLNGLKVSRDSGWGVGGHFNGILSNAEGKKVSFKSFLAGGYNIQREHIRFRITPLKK